MGFDLVCAGSACIDIVARVPRLPGPDQSLPIEAWTQQGGGKVATAAVAAARLGLRVAFVGAVGDDALGRQIWDEFAAAGVDLSAAERQTGRTSDLSIVLADAATHTRAILWSKGTARLERLSAEAAGHIAGASYLLISDASAPVRDALHAGRAAGVTVVMDADFYSPELAGLLDQVDVCIASRDFAQGWMPGASPETVVRRLPCATAIVTLGAHGAVVRHKDDVWTVPAFAVEVVDTTGAGDVYHGAFVAALHYRLPVREAARYAAAAAALSCRALGGRGALPSHHETLAFLSQQPGGAS
ncbi:MAG: hypothetical protein BAA04_12055 [Firmicutes bacterium ZCTH02-B6]|nr:MAG: hypothetical protein BAA04_12055 [Firmicutes bacterium ZCTH02-B6]